MESIARQILSEIASMSITQYQHGLVQVQNPRPTVLTLREKQIYILTVEDAMNLKAVAVNLNMEINSVKRRLTSIYAKSGTTCRLELAVNYWKTKYQELDRGIR